MVSHTVHINSEWSGGKFRLMLSRQEPTEMLCKIHTEKCLFALSVHLTSNEFGVAGCKVGEKSAWNGKRGEGWALSSTAASFSWSVGQTERPPKISAECIEAMPRVFLLVFSREGGEERRGRDHAEGRRALIRIITVSLWDLAYIPVGVRSHCSLTSIFEGDDRH